MKRKNAEVAILDAVVLLVDLAEYGLAAGQVGTVVEALDEENVLVEFADDEGRAYAVAPCRRTDLLTLRYAPMAAA